MNGIIPGEGVEQAKVGESREDVKRRIGRPVCIPEGRRSHLALTGLADFARRARPAQEGK